MGTLSIRRITGLNGARENPAGCAEMQIAADFPAGRRPVPAVSVASMTGNICVARVRSRQEKALAEDLNRLEIEHYLPLRCERRFWGGRRRYVWLPLFAGFVFVGSGDEGHKAARDSRFVWGFLHVANQSKLKMELKTVERILALQPDTMVYPHLVEGKAVEVGPGHPLEGMRGVIDRRGVRCRFWVMVEMFGSSVPMDIDADFLRPIE